jgi:hypothetical protein
MKRSAYHSHSVILWLGPARECLNSSPRQFAVVEVDHLGPILRQGPYSDERAAKRAALRLDSQRAHDSPARQPGRAR